MSELVDTILDSVLPKKYYPYEENPTMKPLSRREYRELHRDCNLPRAHLHACLNEVYGPDACWKREQMYKECLANVKKNKE